MSKSPVFMSEYDDALVYDAEYGQWAGDFDFFLDLIKSGKVLDLACGTGRLTREFATKGYVCVGIDNSQSMIRLAKEKSQGPSIRYVQGDVRNFDLEENFDLVTMAGNSFQALLTNKDQDRLFQCVKRHLQKDGIFAFSTRYPSKDEMKTTDAFEFWHSFLDQNGSEVNVYGQQAYHPQQQTVTYLTKRCWPNYQNMTSVTLKYTNKADIEAQLLKNGFVVLHCYGSFSGGPVLDSSKNMIFVCALK